MKIRSTLNKVNLRPACFCSTHQFEGIDPQAVLPCWPLLPQSLVVENGVYELRAVPATSIALLTNRTVKVGIGL